jgi:hypothetical protein
LIDYCLASSEQYFNYIQDENNINNISKLYRNKERDGSTGSTTFEWHWNSMKSWVRTNNLVFSDGYMHLLFFAIYQRGFSVKGAWNYPNNLPTMIHTQAFRIITWQSLPPPTSASRRCYVSLSPGKIHEYPESICRNLTETDSIDYKQIKMFLAIKDRSKILYIMHSILTIVALLVLFITKITLHL